MLTILTCVSAACDECHEHPEIDDLNPHFTDEREALGWLAGMAWRVLAGGRLVCPTCAARHDCAIYGHEWDMWRTCGCRGLVRSHAPASNEQCLHSHRWCDRCGQRESRAPEGTDVRPAVA